MHKMIEMNIPIVIDCVYLLIDVKYDVKKKKNGIPRIPIPIPKPQGG
jgi:hypothetical protein